MKKAVAKKIRALAATLPECYYQVQHMEIKKGAEMILDNAATNPGIEFELEHLMPDGTTKWMPPVPHLDYQVQQIEQKRMGYDYLKAIYKQHGEAAMLAVAEEIKKRFNK